MLVLSVVVLFEADPPSDTRRCVLPSKLRPDLGERVTLTIDVTRQGECAVVVRWGDHPIRFTVSWSQSVNTAHGQHIVCRMFRLVRTFAGRFH